MDRFQPYNANDDRQSCIGCRKLAHYEDLDEEGLCPQCASEEQEQYEKDKTDQDL